MNKNLVIFIVLSLGIYGGWIWYMGKKYPNMHNPKAAATAVVATKASEAAPAADAATAAPKAAATAIPKATAKKKAAIKEERVTLKTDTMEIVFSNAGASIKSFKLLNYREHVGKDEPVQLIGTEGVYGAFEMSGTSLDTELWNLETKGEPKGSVAFSTTIPNTTMQLRKTFILEGGKTKVIKITLDFVNASQQQVKLPKSFVVWGPNIGLPEHWKNDEINMGGTVQTEGKLDRESMGGEQVFGYKAPKWVSVKNHYFVAAFINDGNFPAAELRTAEPGGVSKTVAAALGLGELDFKPGETRSYSTTLYAGPQDYETLKSFNNNLTAVVQFTFQWLSPLSVFLLSIMKFLHAFVNNWGVAIILLTIVVKLALLYPTHRGMVSSKRMQLQMAKMAPVLESLKKTYKNDAAKLQQETMRLYKEHGVNPLSGCLLMLPQMFIMIALYGALNGAFELRGAYFWGPWIDLSAADPTYILVPLMGASMWLQQKMTPMNTATMSEDQAQMQKMMMTMMPIMFTVMGFFFHWPTGLLLYWSVSNVFGIGQQWYVNKTVK